MVRLTCALALITILVSSNQAFDNPDRDQAPEEQSQGSLGLGVPYYHAVIRLHHSAATDVADALQEWISGQQEAIQPLTPERRQPLRVFAEPASNSLMVTGSPADIADVKRIAEEIDAPPPRVRINLCIAELAPPDDELDEPNEAIPDAVRDGDAFLAWARASDRLRTLSRPQIMTLQGQQAVVEFSDRESGANYRIRLAPRVDELDSVLMELEAERSTVKESPGTAGPVAVRISAETIVLAVGGQPTVLRGLLPTTSDHPRELVIALTPHVDAAR